MRFLYHYYEKGTEPFSASPDRLARIEKEPQERLRKDALRREELEAFARQELIGKGGFPVLRRPLYLVVGECAYLEGLFSCPALLRLPIESFDVNALSFTYGELVSAFDGPGMAGKPYGSIIYTHGEILEAIRKWGLPQIWNDKGQHGPERYIQAQCWMEVSANL